MNKWRKWVGWWVWRSEEEKLEVTHPRWRVRGQRQRSPAAASTILHLHNNHTLEEHRRCGNYNQQPTRGTQPHTIFHHPPPPQQPHPGEDVEIWSILSTTSHRHNKKQTTTYNHPTPPPSSTTTTPRNRQEMWQVQSTTNHWHRASLTLSVTLFFITLSNNHTLEDTRGGEQQKWRSINWERAGDTFCTQKRANWS